MDAMGLKMMSMNRIRAKVEAGERLTFDDGMVLERDADLFTLGELANLVRERRHGRRTYYNVNEHLNPTNVCVYRCTFCAFRADLKSPKGYVMSDEQIVERAAEADAKGATELHIVGGLHHQLPYEWYLNVVRIIHNAYPQLHLKAYTAVEWDWFQRLTGRPTRDLLAEFKDAGLGSLPGGGAEIFHPDIRDKICEHKADPDSWIRIHREAHELGLRSNATMLYGHIEGPEHRIDHLLRLRALQDETGGFQTFIPLAFHPDNTRPVAHSEAVGDHGPADDGDRPAHARQLRAHQGVLGHARHSDRPAFAELRGRRHRRHGRSREDLPRCGLRFASGIVGRGIAAADRRGRLRTDRARHAVSRSRPR